MASLLIFVKHLIQPTCKRTQTRGCAELCSGDLPLHEQSNPCLHGIIMDLKTMMMMMLSHEILLLKLEHYGIRGSILQWFKSYLWNRKQYVYLNGSTSSLRNITCGVPQRSVMGPLLFLLYINDLPNISKILNFYLFADDTNIYYENDSLEVMEKVINAELKET